MKILLKVVLVAMVIILLAGCRKNVTTTMETEESPVVAEETKIEQTTETVYFEIVREELVDELEEPLTADIKEQIKETTTGEAGNTSSEQHNDPENNTDATVSTNNIENNTEKSNGSELKNDDVAAPTDIYNSQNPDSNGENATGDDEL